MQEHIVLRIISRFLFPFIILFGIYVQLHGDYSPGGGFQAGVICASAFIIITLVFGLEVAQGFIPLIALRYMAACGVLIYGGVGIMATFQGGNFLGYSYLFSGNTLKGQQLGIMLVEGGVGLTVFSVMLLLFYTFAERGCPDDN